MPKNLPGSKMPRTLKSPAVNEREPAQHPNGGIRPLEAPSGKMPQRQDTASITHTPLPIPEGKMPRNMQATTPRDPVKR